MKIRWYYINIKLFLSVLVQKRIIICLNQLTFCHLRDYVAASDYHATDCYQLINISWIQ